MDAKHFLITFYDHLAPRLDVYEQVIYLYIYRNSRLIGDEEVTIGFKSARLKIGLGVGKEGVHLSEWVCYKRLDTLQEKGCIKVLGTERAGTRIRLFLPEEIAGVVPDPEIEESIDIEEVDFFEIKENRVRILEREEHKCFYCFRALDNNNYVLEHVVSRPEGNNSYRNLVASCLKCNNRKGSFSAADYIRTLYREGFLSESEFEDRLSHLELLKEGKLRPV